MTPWLSVVIPTYNYAHYLSAAIDSVLNQVGVDGVELIVVDDGSTDNTQMLLSQYGERLISVFQENQGGAAARNTGAQKAQGRWVLFLDSDDELLEGALQVFLDAANAYEDYDYIVAGHVSQREDGTERSEYPETFFSDCIENFRAHIYKQLNIVDSGVSLIKRNVFDKIIYPASARNNYDLVFLGLVFATKKCTSIQALTARIKAHPNRVRHDIESIKQTGLQPVELLFDAGYLPQACQTLRAKFYSRRCLSLFRSLYKAKYYGPSLEYYVAAFGGGQWGGLRWTYSSKALRAAIKYLMGKGRRA